MHRTTAPSRFHTTPHHPARELLLIGTVLLGGLLACKTPFEPPAGAVRYDPPAVYREWWSQVEACSGLQGEYQRVVWYESDHFGDGYWQHPHNIYLAPAYREYTWLVQHEMLHDLLQDGSHDAPAWSVCRLV